MGHCGWESDAYFSSQFFITFPDCERPVSHGPPSSHVPIDLIVATRLRVCIFIIKRIKR